MTIPGWELKEEIKKLLDEMGLDYKDFGTNSTASCDYPIYAIGRRRRFQRRMRPRHSDLRHRHRHRHGGEQGEGHAGVCTCSDVYSAELSKRHNNSNILTMGARVVGIDLAKMIATHWLTATFEGGRHQRPH